MPSEVIQIRLITVKHVTGSEDFVLFFLFELSLLRLLLLVPLDALLQLDAVAPETVQRAADGQVHLAVADPLDRLEIVEVPAPAGVRDGDGGPRGQLRHELLVDALLQAFVVGGVDEELGAVRLQLLYGFF